MPAPGLSNGRQRRGRANRGHRPGAGIWLRMPPSAWRLGLVAGILELVLGFWASQQRLPAREALLLIWVGFFVLFRGISEIVIAFELKSAQHC